MYIDYFSVIKQYIFIPRKSERQYAVYKSVWALCFNNKTVNGLLKRETEKEKAQIKAKTEKERERQ